MGIGLAIVGVAAFAGVAVGETLAGLAFVGGFESTVVGAALTIGCSVNPENC